MFSVALTKDRPSLSVPYNVIVVRFTAESFPPNIPLGLTYLTSGIPPALSGTEFGHILNRLVQGDLAGFRNNRPAIGLLFRPDPTRKPNGDLEFVTGVFSSRGHHITR